jgi:hypothetical protein
VIKMLRFSTVLTVVRWFAKKCDKNVEVLTVLTVVRWFGLKV